MTRNSRLRTYLRLVLFKQPISPNSFSGVMVSQEYEFYITDEQKVRQRTIDVVGLCRFALQYGVLFPQAGYIVSQNQAAVNHRAPGAG